MSLWYHVMLFCFLFLNVMPTPVKADMGDTIAWVVGMCIVGVCVCAGIGAYSRKQSEYS